MSFSTDNVSFSEENKPPRYLYVSGNPLLLAGFNGKYELISTNPMQWSLKPHTFLGIPIRPTKILQIENSKWVLMSNDGYIDIFHIGNDSKYPIGEWSGGLRVDGDYQPITQWIRNYGIVSLISSLTLVLLIYLLPILVKFIGDNVLLIAVLALILITLLK